MDQIAPLLTKKTITVSIAHPTIPASPIQGFRFFWAFYVNGFRPEFHCQPCFKGRRVEQFCTGRVQSGRSYSLDAMDIYDYVYICGVGTGPQKMLARKNLHLPLKYATGEVVQAVTYNGYSITAENASLLSIPALPDGWHGRDRETTRCKNFQFAVAYFGQSNNLSGPPNSQFATL